MKKIRGDKPIGVIKHIYNEISQGNSLCSHLYLKQAKMSCFPFICSPFIVYKNGEQEGNQYCLGEGELTPMGEGWYWGNG
jgi:hypothetical protein